MALAVLDFTVRLVATSADLHDACKVRSQAYGHHLPAMQHLLQPDDQDRQAGTVTFLCRDKQSGRPIGTLRIQHSGSGPLQLEHSVTLPHRLVEHPRAELTRLAVVRAANPLVRLALMKASYLYCLASQVRWMVIGARSAALTHVYQHLGFSDVFGPEDRTPLHHAGGLPHRILAFDVTAAERIWFAGEHDLYPFMVDTFHPDLQLFPGQ